MTRRVSLAAAFLCCLALTEAPAQTEWLVVPDTDGRFEGMFPAMPQAYTDQRVRSGVVATTRVLGAGTPAFYCMAGYTEYSGSIARDGGSELQAVRDDFTNSWYATVLESRNVTLLRPPDENVQAVSFTAIADTRRYTSIIAVEGARFYHVVASSQRFGFSEGDVARCLSGFKLTPNS